ncbi:LOW QUALITY PROTEIN: selenocysteine insertion sequence-binding protein 2-like [Lampetra planeri]
MEPRVDIELCDCTEENLKMEKVEEMPARQEDGAMGKKKRKKKRKKAKGASEHVESETEESLVHQEPPRFEDEEEFPGLTPALTGTERLTPRHSGAKLCNEKAEKISGKKSKAPVQLDIGNMLAVLEKRHQSQKAGQDTKPVVSVCGGLPVVQKQPAPQKKPPWQQEKIAHNPLDSTSPLVKKGKQREVPKAKKPTPLKKVILKEREERKQRRLLEERGLCERGDVEPDTTEDVEQHTPPVGTLSTDRPKVHSRKFREYCSQMLSKDVDQCATALLKELVRFQDRLYQKDPMKARMKRRIVMGLREVLKHLKLRKVKCVIISPNCERVQAKGGLDEALHAIIDTCREQGVPFIFALSRKALGRCVNKMVPVSLVGIFNYDGAQDHYHKMIELSSEARRAYEVMMSSLEQTDETEEEQAADAEELQINKLGLSGAPEHVGDTTQPEEPDYMKMWKKLWANECSHELLKLEEQLSSVQLNAECCDDTDEDEKS